jgi:hypothetical protein
MSRRDRLDVFLLVLMHGPPPLFDEIEPFQRRKHRLVAVDAKDGPVPFGRAHVGHPAAHLECGIKRRVEHVAELRVASLRARGGTLLLEEGGGIHGEDLAQRGEDVPQLGGSRQGGGGGLRARARKE